MAFLNEQQHMHDILTMKHMDIQGPNLFEHQLKNVKDQHKYNLNTITQLQQHANMINGRDGSMMASPLSIDHRSSPVPTITSSRVGLPANKSNRNGSGLSENPLDVQILGNDASKENTSEHKTQRAEVESKADKLQKVATSRNSPLAIRGGTKTTQVSIEVPHRVPSHKRSQKQVSKIVTDKLVIEESLKDHRPYGNKWVNNKDPDIYESELNISQTGGGDEAKDGRGGSRAFMKLITKLPSKMDHDEAMQQDLDLYQLQGDGANTMARATLFPADASINANSRDGIDNQKYMDETKMEFSTSLGDRISKVKDGINM